MAVEELIIGRIVVKFMMYGVYKSVKFYNHIQTAENANNIRLTFPEMGLMVFIAISFTLPRRNDEFAPMVNVIPFDCDNSFKVIIEVPTESASLE